ncbi:MAG: phosphatidate cytidylyltransferase [Sphingorhabdus sp.]
MSEDLAPPPKPRSDLGIRTLSGVVMMVIAILALVLEGFIFATFVAVVAIATFWEWTRLISNFSNNIIQRFMWNIGGLGYIGIASSTLISLCLIYGSISSVVSIVGSVIATDIGAYFMGRMLKGPKIAPSISPSKTWSGLGGGIVAASIFFLMWSQIYTTPICQWYYDFIDWFSTSSLIDVPMFDDRCHMASPRIDLQLILISLALGLITAVTAQAGDFFESWMKRRAGVKDSGTLIPGHGGVFDRVDGLLAVSLLMGILIMIGGF